MARMEFHSMCWRLAAFRYNCQVADERTIELEPVYWKPLEVGQVGIARTEVVDCNSHPHVLEFSQNRHRSLRLVHGHGLRQFHFEQMRRHASRLQGPRDLVFKPDKCEPLCTAFSPSRSQRVAATTKSGCRWPVDAPLKGARPPAGHPEPVPATAVRQESETGGWIASGGGEGGRLGQAQWDQPAAVLAPSA